MEQKQGFVHLLVLIIIAAVVAVYFLAVKGVINLPFNLPGRGQEPTVDLQTQYQNPFDKDAQFRNPFAEYKNPFDALK